MRAMKGIVRQTQPYLSAKQNSYRQPSLPVEGRLLFLPAITRRHLWIQEASRARQCAKRLAMG